MNRLLSGDLIFLFNNVCDTNDLFLKDICN